MIYNQPGQVLQRSEPDASEFGMAVGIVEMEDPYRRAEQVRERRSAEDRSERTPGGQLEE